MKKSVKEQMLRHAVHPYPHKGYGSELVMPVHVALRIIRRACEEAKQAGLQAGWQCREDAYILGGTKKAYALARQIASEHVSEIIDGKKGRRK